MVTNITVLLYRRSPIPDEYQKNKITIVGGGDSAVKAADVLSQQAGNIVRISYRKDKFSRIKGDKQDRIQKAIDEGRVEFLASTNVTEIGKDFIKYKDAQGDEHSIQNDYIFIMIGGVLPTGILKDLGIRIDTKFGEPLSSR